MTTSSQPAPTLEQARTAHPGYDITADRRRDPVTYHAVARDIGTTPSVVVTSDLAELVAVLGTSRP